MDFGRQIEFHVRARRRRRLVRSTVGLVFGGIGHHNSSYLHQFIMPPVIILPPPKTRTSNKTTMAVPMMITTVLVFLVFVPFM
jgi:hypothetical protein